MRSQQMNQLNTKDDHLSALIKIRDESRFKVPSKIVELENRNLSSKEAIEKYSNKATIREKCLKSHLSL